jgi:hypothetical protein
LRWAFDRKALFKMKPSLFVARSFGLRGAACEADPVRSLDALA